MHQRPEYQNDYNQLIFGVAENKPEIEINGHKLHTKDIPIKYCSTEPLQDINVYKLHGEIAYDPDNQKRYLEESNDEYQWGEYRVKIQEEKLSKSTNSNSQYLEQVKQKLAKHNNNYLNQTSQHQQSTLDINDIIKNSNILNR